MIERVARIARSYDAFWMREASGLHLGCFRILFALYLLAYLAVLAPHVVVLFSNQGVYAPYLVPDLAPSPAVAWLLFGVMPVLAVSILIGYRTELSALLLLALYLHHYFLQLAVKQSSFERLIILYLAILALAGSGQRLGIDGARAPAPRLVWAERLIAAQSVFLYTGSGLWKLLNPAWHSGALLQSTFQGMWATPLAFEIAALGLPATAWTAASWSIIALELSLGPLLIWRKTRMVAVLLAAAFHAGNWLLLFIPEFLLCVAALVVFLDERTLERAVSALRGLAWLRRPRPAGAS
jgi:vitamin K-dependent gamma-carboxylase